MSGICVRLGNVWLQASRPPVEPDRPATRGQRGVFMSSHSTAQQLQLTTPSVHIMTLTHTQHSHNNNKTPAVCCATTIPRLVVVIS